MNKKLMKISEYRETYFCKGSAPTATTVKRWIQDNHLPGVQIGKIYYIDANKLNMTGNPLVDSVLAAS